MRRLFPVAFTLIAAASLTACADTIRMTDSTWMVTNIYSSPDEPNVVSDLVVTQPTVNFGRASVSGHTGCAPFQGLAEFTLNGEASTSNDADHLRFTEVEFDALPDDCMGQERLVHDELVELLPGAFDVTRYGDTEILLTSDVDALDRPSIRMVSWVISE